MLARTVPQAEKEGLEGLSVGGKKQSVQPDSLGREVLVVNAAGSAVVAFVFVDGMKCLCPCRAGIDDTSKVKLGACYSLYSRVHQSGASGWRLGKHDARNGVMDDWKEDTVSRTTDGRLGDYKINTNISRGSFPFIVCRKGSLQRK